MNYTQDAATALTELKGYFPGRTLPKGSPLELYFSSAQRTALFQMRVSRRHGLCESCSACSAVPVAQRAP